VSSDKKTGGIRGGRKIAQPFYPSGRPLDNEYDGTRNALRDFSKFERAKGPIRLGSNAGVSDSGGIIPFPGFTLAKEGEIALFGAVTLSEGSNITLTQVNQDIEIAFGATLSATLTNDATTNVIVATTAAVSKVHIEYDVTQSTYREVGALDVVVDGGNGRIANKSYSTVGSTGKVMTTITADQDGANLRLNITIDDHSATADFKATYTLVATH